MTSSRLTSPARALVVALAACVLLLAVSAERASAYSKPPGGTWRFQNLFDRTKSGSFALTRDAARVAKLVLVPGERSVDACGTAAIRLVSRPKVKSYRTVSGRYAVAKLRSGLFVPTAMRFKRGSRSFTAKLLLLWDDTGRMVTNGQFESGDCRIDFYARKR